MTGCFIRRFLLILPTVIGATMAVFFITRITPGGPMERYMQQMAMNEKGGSKNAGASLSEEQLAELSAYYGFDKPYLEAYGIWLGVLPREETPQFVTFEKDQNELKSYCLSFSTAYHLSDSAWMVFDELVKNSPLAEIPNKIQFLKANRYYETSDDGYLYFLKVAKYRISDNISPLEFVKDDIRNIILNKRKVELAKKLEDEVYNKAVREKEFEVFQ